MVIFFKGSIDYLMYMGKDKYENEDLIRYGLPEDVWFHVDNYSSAHVYLRLKPGQSLIDIDKNIIIECGQLVKANSIEGCKLKEVDVVYTLWSNLHKTNDMETGQIGYHDSAQVLKVRIAKDNSIVNRLNKTKRESFPNLSELQQIRLNEIQTENKLASKAQKQSIKLKEKNKRAEEINKRELESFS